LGVNVRHKYKWAFEKEPKVERLKCMELQELVDLSEAILLVHSSLLYGLITGEPISDESFYNAIKYKELGERLKIYPIKENVVEYGRMICLPNNT
jgi:hypothetical protein